MTDRPSHGHIPATWTQTTMVWAMLLAVASTPAHAQHAPSVTIRASNTTSPPQASAPTTTAQPTDPARTTPTLDSIQVIAPRPLIIDLDALRNRSETSDTVFNRNWRDPPNLRSIGLNGGLAPLLTQYAGQALTAGARKLPGWKTQVQPAIARPPPSLDQAQLQRARQWDDASAPSGSASGN